MDYLLKSYRLDEDVVKAIAKLKQRHGSANKWLRAVLRLDKAIVSEPTPRRLKERLYPMKLDEEN